VGKHIHYLNAFVKGKIHTKNSPSGSPASKTKVNDVDWRWIGSWIFVVERGERIPYLPTSDTLKSAFSGLL
jgi:hypothetical protein